MPKKTNKSNTKYMKTLHQYNNKRVIIIAEYSGKDERVVPIIEKGILGTIKNCNAIQKDIEFTFFSLQDEDNTAIGIMVDDDCPFEDITIKSFFVAQMATFSGLFGRTMPVECIFQFVLVQVIDKIIQLFNILIGEGSNLVHFDLY